MRNQIILFGWITLLLFPLPGFYLQYYFNDLSFVDFISLSDFKPVPIVYGLQFGVVYAFIAYLFMKAPFFDKIPVKVNKLVQNMKLSVVDGLFLSFCAGVGEELLFRQGIQSFTGVLITSILFVALHGYLNPFNLRFSVYGLIVLPFILLISYGLDAFGIWFCIAAHFAYDAVLFTFMIREGRSSETTKKELI
jgi:membrane protease YdiL (CAAX protease family)